MQDNENSFSLEELMEIAVSSNEPIEYEELNDAVLFSKELSVEPGEEKVPASIIYEKYKEWKDDDNYESRAMFFANFSKLYEKKKTRRFQCYLIQPGIFDTSDEAIRRAVEVYDKERQAAARRKKRNKKK